MELITHQQDIVKIERGIPAVVWTISAIDEFVTQTAPFDMTDLIVGNPALLASLQRAIKRLEPGNLLRDDQVFGSE